MATDFPTGLDAFNNPSDAAGDKQNTAGVLHDEQHADANDAIEALEAKVGIDGSADTDSLDYLIKNALLPWSIYVNPRLGSAANTGWSLAEINTNFLRTDTAAQNNEVFFDVVLAAGTWTLKADWGTGTNRGIAHVSFDGGADVGTMDTYNGAGETPGVPRTITGIVIATTGKKRVSFKMASKNASSSNYNGYLIGFTFVRTA